MNNEYPPYVYLFQVAEHCPNAVSTYMSLWKDRDANNKITVSRKDVKREYLLPFNTFENHLISLVKEGLVSINENKKLLEIELTDYNLDLCDPLC